MCLERHDSWDEEEDVFYTSNGPRVFAKKVIALLSSAAVHLQIDHRQEKREKGDKYDRKERLIQELLHRGDERLLKRLELPLMKQLSWKLPIRGWQVTRVMLYDNQATGQMTVDVTPFDPRNCVWHVGPEGLEWVCHIIWRTKRDVFDVYGLELLGVDVDDDDSVPVYDFYNRYTNAVVIQGAFVKRPTPHSASLLDSPQCPVVIRFAGNEPYIKTDGVVDGIARVGESVFDSNRGVYKDFNDIMTVYKDLVRRSKDRSWKHSSKGAESVLEGDVNEAEVVIPLDSEAGEKLELLEIPEMTKDAAALVGVLGGELQRGGLPNSVYGELAFQLSGFAIQTLQQSIGTVLDTYKDALTSSLADIAELLFDQYVVQFGGEIRVQDRPVTAEEMRDLPKLVVKLVPDIPQDLAAKINMAQMARSGPGGIPLLPDDYIMDKILQIQDVGQVLDGVAAQQAESANPMAATWTLVLASVRQGREDLAQIYMAQLLMLVKEAETKGLDTTAEIPEEIKAQVETGYDPSVTPRQTLGLPNPAPTPQQGPIAAPGTPRPASGDVAARLADIGLVGPGGA
jgi:hypothetical protein